MTIWRPFENRLPRGRTYVRNGSVIDIKIEPGRVKAQVMGSDLYQIEISIAAVPAARWKTLAKECTGSIASLVELLQGKLSKAVMARLCQPKSGLPHAEGHQAQRFGCSCPDWATMCKHVAAVLYGVGAQLDEKPELLFLLRQVDANELVTQAASLSIKTNKAPAKGRLLDDAALADVFGIEMAPSPPSKQKKPAKPAATTKTAVMKKRLSRERPHPKPPQNRFRGNPCANPDLTIPEQPSGWLHARRSSSPPTDKKLGVIH